MDGTAEQIVVSHSPVNELGYPVSEGDAENNGPYALIFMIRNGKTIPVFYDCERVEA